MVLLQLIHIENDILKESDRSAIILANHLKVQTD